MEAGQVSYRNTTMTPRHLDYCGRFLFSFQLSIHRGLAVVNRVVDWWLVVWLIYIRRSREAGVWEEERGKGEISRENRGEGDGKETRIKQWLF